MQESQNIEFKSKWKDDYLAWICGFANSEGGKLYLGYDDNGNVIGLTNARKLLEDLPNKIRDALGIVVSIIFSIKKATLTLKLMCHHTH